MDRGTNRAMRLRAGAVAAVLLAALLAGCARVQVEGVRSFAAGVATAKDHAATAFAGVNDLALNSEIDYAATQPTLNEGSFPEALPADAIAKWMAALSQISSYATSLQSLVSPDASQSAEKSLVTLGEKIHATSPSAYPSPAVATGFTKLAGILLEGRAQKHARAAMRAADPAIHAILAAMADAIGGSPEEGIRLTVRATWATAMGKVQSDFLSATRTDDRREQAGKFVAMMKSRSAQDQTLSSLRSSLLALAGAHAALAAREPGGAAMYLQLVQQELQDTRSLLDRFTRIQKGGS